MMRFLKIFFFVVVCAAFGSGAVFFFFRPEPAIQIGGNPSIDSVPSSSDHSDTEQTNTPEDGVYTIFSMNVHDWVFPEKSIETLHRVIDLHEKYSIPVDIYLTDPMVQLYVVQAPDLIERLKTSPVVAISYHLRPPMPVYDGFDFIGLQEMSATELSKTLLDYTEHALDLTTGLPTDAPGGYEYLKTVIGYAPKVVTHTTSPIIGAALSAIYKEKGAVFAVIHNKKSDLGDVQYDLFVRPEHVEIKLYEYAQETTDASTVFAEALAELPENGMRFLGIKYHENNFYTNGTPWETVFWADSEKTIPREPPYDVSTASVTLKSQSVQDAHWTLYESALSYAHDHRDSLHPVNAFDLEDWLLK